MTQNAARLSSTTPNPALNDESSSIEEGVVKSHEGGTSYSENLRRNDLAGESSGSTGAADNIRSVLREGNGVLSNHEKNGNMKKRVPLEHR